MEKDKNLAYTINIDILTIFRIAKNIQWGTVRESSIYRILYLSSVLYSFINENRTNPFNNYKFSIDSSGPYESNIAKSITYLLKDDFLKRDNSEDEFVLGSGLESGFFDLEIEKERVSWIKDIMMILGIYGENKIYEFIFRDPEYQKNIKSNSKIGLNVDSNNETIVTLNKFKIAFEESLNENKVDISSQTYLKLYFEYVFSKILKREE